MMPSIRRRSPAALALCGVSVLLTALLASPSSAADEPESDRPHQVWSEIRDEPADYVYRTFIQVPWGIAWGPDDHLYVADWLGGHVVRLAQDGSMDDLGLWKTNPGFGDPIDVAFDNDGVLHAAGNYVMRIDAGGNGTRVNLNGTPNGGLAFDDKGDLYIAESHSGNILRLRNGQTETVASGLINPSSIEFGPDGYLYVAQREDSRVMRVDPDTGAKSVLFDAPVWGDVPYLTVDDDGDIWLFEKFSLYQISPSGDLKPFMVDGVEYQYFNDFWWAITGGLSFEDDGSLWMASYNGSLIRLASQSTTPDSHSFTTEVKVRGFGPTSVAEATDGSIYTHNWMTGELWRISPDGELETLMTFGIQDYVNIAADPNDPIVYVGTPMGEVVTLDASGQTEHHAWLRGASTGLITASDGSLIALERDAGWSPRAIVRITGTDEIEVLTDSLAGRPIPDHELEFGPAADGGAYVYSRSTQELFEVSADGSTSLVVDFDDLSASERPPFTFTSAPDGQVYPIGYEVYRLTNSLQLELIARDTVGDPDAATVSQDGSILYVGELGSIDAIPLRAYDGRFEDDDGLVFEPDIEKLAAAGITKGCNPPLNDRYCPQDSVTRGQMAAFLVRALELTATSGIDFIDDNDSIFEPDIERLATAGITRGCNPPLNDRYCPTDRVTRGQMAAFLARALRLPPGTPDAFIDDDNSVFETDIEALAEAGITRGCNPPLNDRYCPTSPVTRAQMAAFLVRALGL